MVEHADIIDTSLLHEPKGITESSSGEVYISDNDENNTNPTGHWGKLPVESIGFTVPQTVSQTYTNFASPVSLVNGIAGTPAGSLAPAANFTTVNQNTVELYTAVNNLLTRLAIVEGNLAKVQTLLNSLDSGLKAAGFVAEEE